MLRFELAAGSVVTHRLGILDERPHGLLVHHLAVEVYLHLRLAVDRVDVADPRVRGVVVALLLSFQHAALYRRAERFFRRQLSGIDQGLQIAMPLRIGGRVALVDTLHLIVAFLF